MRQQWSRKHFVSHQICILMPAYVPVQYKPEVHREAFSSPMSSTHARHPLQWQKNVAPDKASHCAVRRPGSSQLDGSWQPGAIQKLFEKELDNRHEEALLMAQLAGQSLAEVWQKQHGSLPAGRPTDSTKHWVMQCLQVSASRFHSTGDVGRCAFTAPEPQVAASFYERGSFRSLSEPSQ